MENQTKKIALIIGGSRGIGRAVALRLADSGFDIWLTYKCNHPAAESVKADIEKNIEIDIEHIEKRLKFLELQSSLILDKYIDDRKHIATEKFFLIKELKDLLK